MLFLLSPAKKLDETREPPKLSTTTPRLIKETQSLIDVALKLSPPEIETLMRVSEKIALLTATRFNELKIPVTKENAKPAIFLFNGDAYEGLDAYHRSLDELDYLQKHLVILSGLYGAVQALDLIQPYRLEMGTSLKTPYGKNLYDFWGNKITQYINQLMQKEQKQYIINLASNEYFKAVQTQGLKATIITPIFKDLKNGQYKTISFYAKRARGLMVKYASLNQLKKPDELKFFNEEDYYFKGENPKNPNEWLFYRG